MSTPYAVTYTVKVKVKTRAQDPELAEGKAREVLDWYLTKTEEWAGADFKVEQIDHDEVEEL